MLIRMSGQRSCADSEAQVRAVFFPSRVHVGLDYPAARENYTRSYGPFMASSSATPLGSPAPLEINAAYPPRVIPRHVESPPPCGALYTWSRLGLGLGGQCAIDWSHQLAVNTFAPCSVLRCDHREIHRDGWQTSLRQTHRQAAGNRHGDGDGDSESSLRFS